ncbi:GGDEF domain-containing response regulator [Pseudomonas oryzae]|uniref:Response regulator receiver modulated diguanylate cyclase n=1 Tax=Pseudomonas oryzae TaxID=1392877 RepID=A0A1H1LHW5_9PSED|nr:response regulator [Pseudomonas oryzae]SDR74007.1 response regulator receiver modulated diguanylate cyclase [Pseudomonas oryzae]
MTDPNLSILVVDDARFSSMLIGRLLQQAGYHDIRYASSASEALAALDQRAANVLLVDWMMPEMDGLELTSQVRQLDDSSEHYTYIILLTGNEGDKLVAEAFDRGVDDFVNKATVNEQLAPRVQAADRLCSAMQRLLREKRQLAHNITNLEQRNVVDALTGVGNQRYLRQHLATALRQLESRGGALCYLLISLENLAGQDEGLQREVQYNVARRLQQMLRPLDAVARLDDRYFAAVAMVDDLRECSSSSFRRVHDGLNLKALKVSSGFFSLQAAVGMVCIDASDCPLKVDEVIQAASRQVEEARRSGRIASQRLQRTASSH